MDEKNGFYFDYNHINKTICNAYTLAATYPLFFNISESVQAEKVGAVIKEKFLYNGGLITTINNSGQQWDAPKGGGHSVKSSVAAAQPLLRALRRQRFWRVQPPFLPCPRNYDA